MTEPGPSNLLDVLRLANDLITTHDTSQVLTKVLHTIAQFSGAERGYIVRTKGELMIPGAIYPKPGKGQTELIRMSRKAIDLVMNTRKIVKVGGREPVWPFDASQSVHDMGIRALLCIPLVFKGNPIGVVYLHHTQDPNVFENVSMDLLETLASYAAIAITNAELYHQAITDPLTGLYSHRYFETVVEREMQRCGRIKKPLSIMFLDIDHFKRVNDTYGHQVGSALIRDIGVIITTVVRRTDVVVHAEGQPVAGGAAARYGGDEFEVLLPETSKEGSRIVAERLLSVMSIQPFQLGQASIPISVSVGLATYPDDASDVQALLRRADEAMYEAKQRGRGRVFAFP